MKKGEVEKNDGILKVIIASRGLTHPSTFSTVFLYQKMYHKNCYKSFVVDFNIECFKRK